MRLLLLALLLASAAVWSLPVVSEAEAVTAEQTRAATALATLLPSLQRGGYVIVVRHGPTDPRQRDVYPLDYDDMTGQRQLSERGRRIARETGSALDALAIPIGKVYTSRLNRALRSATALRQLVAAPPEPGTNTLIVTHKTNMQDAFGKRWADVEEGESLLFRPDGSGAHEPVARVPASDWIAVAYGR